MNKVLILGGTGFIGSELTSLLSKNFEVHILSQNLTSKNIVSNTKVFNISYNKKNFLNILNKYTYVSIFFLSGNPHPQKSYKYPELDIDLLISPLLSLLESLRSIKFEGKLWFASSVAVYGSLSGKLSEDLIPLPISPYGIAKLNAENYCKYYVNENNLNIGILRLFSSYGPNLKRQVVYDIYSKIIDENPLELNLLSKENDSRDMSYVTDIARAIVFLNKKLIPKGDIYNIGSGKEYLISDIVKFIAASLSYKGKINFATNSQSYDGDSWYADNNKLKSLGFEYKYDLENGLKQTISKWKKDIKT